MQMLELATVPSASGVADGEESSALMRLHDSLLQNILGRADIQSRIAASMTCRRMARVSAEHPPSVVDLSSDGVHPEACRRYIERAKGAVETLTTARQQQRTACAAASARRFATGLRCTQVVPYTAGPAALRLAACLPRLRVLALHEATCCLGGMTDEFAGAVAAHCPLLSSLEVAFTRYSLPSEFFTDAGMLALCEGCPRLASLSLTNCGAITDRSLYAVASHCRGLRELALGGYHELITDYGTVVLFQACTSLRRVLLGGKLRRVTDESAAALAAGAGAAGLREVKLTRSMGDRALAALGDHCTALCTVDASKCEQGSVTAAAVAALLRALTAAAATSAAKAAASDTQAPAAAAAADAGTTEAGAGAAAAGDASRGPGFLRVLLPRGVTAAEVLRLGPADGCAAGSGRWRAVVPEPPAAAVPPAAVRRVSSGGGGGGVGPAAASVTVAATAGPVEIALAGPGEEPRGAVVAPLACAASRPEGGGGVKRFGCAAPEPHFQPEEVVVSLAP